MPIETDFFNLKKRIGDRIKELYSERSGIEHNLMVIDTKIEEGKRQLKTIDYLEIQMEEFLDESGKLLKEYE